MFYSVSLCLVSKKFKKVCQECSHTPGFEHLLKNLGQVLLYVGVPMISPQVIMWKPYILLLSERRLVQQLMCYPNYFKLIGLLQPLVI